MNQVRGFPGSLICGQLMDQLKNYWLLNDGAPYSKLVVNVPTALYASMGHGGKLHVDTAWM